VGLLVGMMRVRNERDVQSIGDEWVEVAKIKRVERYEKRVRDGGSSTM